MKLFCRQNPALPKQAPEWIHCVPLGHWLGHWSGREIEITTEHTAQIVANWKRSRIDIVVDYEHQTLSALHNGQPAPAAGWIYELEARDTGVWGRVRWTDRARAHLEAEEYRYQSPVLELESVDGVTGEPAGMALSSVALTNNPFFAGQLEPVINRASGPGVTMEQILKTVLAMLGLPETATEEQVKTALQALLDLKKAETPPADPEMAARADLGAAVCAAFGWKKGGIPANAKADLTKALSKEGFVSAEEHFKVLARAEALQAQLDDETPALVQKALDAGKITPAMKDAFSKMVRADKGAATAWMDAAPVIIPGGIQTTKKGGAATPALSPQEQAACKALGLTPEQYLKAQKKKE